MSNKRFDLIALSVTKSLGATEIRGIGFHQVAIEFVLTNDLTESIPNSRTIAVAGIVL